MRMRGAGLGIACLLLLGAFAGLAPQPAGALDLTGAHGGDLRVALQDFTGLDPRTAGDADRRVLGLLYDSLARVDPESLEAVPWVATDWKWDGNASILVYVREDLRFSDGTAYDADDVAFSLSQYQKGGDARWNVTGVDATTLRFDFGDVGPWDWRTSTRAGPGLFFTEALSAPIAWRANGAPGALSSSGPFYVASYAQDTDPQGVTRGSLVLKPNPYHFSGRPNLDTVTFRWPYTVELDANGNTTADDAGCALMLGDVHLIGWTVLSIDLTNTRDCQAGYGGFPNRPADHRESLLSTDQNRTSTHVSTIKNPGTDLLYFGYTFNANSIFSGPVGSDGQRLRSAIYWFANKANYVNTAGAGSTSIARGANNALNAPWAPASCEPWTPCDVVAEASFTGAGPTTGTDTGPGILNLTANGLLDRDGDGVRELSTGVPISFRVIAPDFGVDWRTTVAADLSLSLTQGRLGVTLDTYNTTAAWEAAIQDCQASGSCMYLQRYDRATQSPDWLYGMPEIAAAMDDLVDLHLNLGAMCYEVSCRQLHVGHVGHLLGSAADFLPVLHFDALEAFDFRAFEGWVSQFGGVNNLWTYLGLRMPALGSLHARITIAPTRSVQPGRTTHALVNVEDDLGRPVADAIVELTLSPGTGALLQATGPTDGLGVFQTDYTAPADVAGRTDLWITATVAKPQFAGASAAASLTVHPSPPAALQVAVNRPKLEINARESTQIIVQVRDGGGTGVSGARVRLSTNLPGATITPSSGTTDPDGLFRAMFRADVKQGMRYQIYADVSADGYADDTKSVALLVLSDSTEPVREIDVPRNVPGFEAAYALGAIAVALVAVALRRKREVSRPPNV